MIDTSCQDCTFSRKAHDKQIGCVMGFLEDMQTVNKNVIYDGTYYILKNVICPYRNYENWSTQDALSRSIPRINFVVFHSETDTANLVKTIQSIVNIPRFMSHGRLIITYTTKDMKNLINVVGSLLDLNMVHFVSILDEEAYWAHEAFLGAKNGYISLINEGYELDFDPFDVIHHALYKRGERVVGIQGLDEDNNMRTLMCIFVKMLKFDKLGTFEEKVEALREAQNIQSQLLFTWKELHDSVNV